MKAFPFLLAMMSMTGAGLTGLPTEAQAQSYEGAYGGDSGGGVPVYDPTAGSDTRNKELRHELEQELKTQLRNELRQTLGQELRQEFNQEMRLLRRQLQPVLATSAAADRTIGSTDPAEAEEWKGRPSERGLSLGGLAGMATFDGTVGLAVQGVVAGKIAHEGFIPDINDQVFIEGQAGPLFVSGEVGLQFSSHLRWDFQKNQNWIIYALGGLGGIVTGDDLGNAWRVYPRTGLGGMWKVAHDVWLRGELSHELIGFGAVIDL